MGLLEPTHLVIIAIIVLLLFGPKKIPELMRGLGKGMGELQKGINEGKEALHNAMSEIEHHATVEPTVPDKVTTAAPNSEPATNPAPTAAQTEPHPAASSDHSEKSA